MTEIEGTSEGHTLHVGENIELPYREGQLQRGIDSDWVLL